MATIKSKKAGRKSGKKKAESEADVKKRYEKLAKEQEAVNSKQVLYVMIVMAIILVVFFAGYFIFQQSKVFYYKDFRFEKIKYDKLPLYYTKIPMIQLSGNPVNYNLYLNNDPRSLNIEIEGKVEFLSKNIFVSLSTGFEKCDDTTLAMTNLGMLFGAMGLEAKGALSDKGEAEAAAVPYVTCENTKNNTVILYKIADETEKTSIKQNENCYVVSVSNCKILEATEALIVQTIYDMQRA